MPFDSIMLLKNARFVCPLNLQIVGGQGVGQDGGVHDRTARPPTLPHITFEDIIISHFFPDAPFPNCRSSWHAIDSLTQKRTLKQFAALGFNVAFFIASIAGVIWIFVTRHGNPEGKSRQFECGMSWQGKDKVKP